MNLRKTADVVSQAKPDTLRTLDGNELHGMNIRGNVNDDQPGWKTTAEITMRGVRRTAQTSQFIVICGESGSGRTWATKLMLRYIGKMGAPPPGAFDRTKNLPTIASFSKTPLEERITRSNPVMEAFGNAKTKMKTKSHRNENSSRFGKLVNIFLSNLPAHVEKMCISSAGIVKYLLEKVRIVHRAGGERCFHIIYQLCTGVNGVLGA